MKAIQNICILLVLFAFGNTIAQEKNAEAKTALETLLESKNFEFVANTALSTTSGPINLVGSNYAITFSPEMIVSHMPFYGRAYSGMAMGRDKGMRFKGKPENFTVTATKKGYEVKATVKDDTDIFVISFEVKNSNFTILTISSNNREAISFQGEVIGVEQ